MALRSMLAESAISSCLQPAHGHAGAVSRKIRLAHPHAREPYDRSPQKSPFVAKHDQRAPGAASVASAADVQDHRPTHRLLCSMGEWRRLRAGLCERSGDRDW